MPCEHILKSGQRKGEQCGKGKADRCSVHKKQAENKEQRVAKNAEDLAAFKGEVVESQAAPETRIKKSAYALTINTNKNYEALKAEGLDKKFERLMMYLFDEKNILDFIDCREGAPCFRENPDLLVQTRVGYRYEIGGDLNRIHCHSSIEIDHRTLVNLNIIDLRKFVDTYMGYKLHINSQVMRSISSVTWEKYLNKGTLGDLA